MSVSSTQVPVVPLSATSIWPLFGPAEFGPLAADVPSRPRCLTPGPAKADVVGVDLGGVVTVVVGERRVHRHARRAAVGRAGAQEVVRLGEQRERRRPGRVGVDHVQDRLLGRVGQVVRDLLGGARVGVGRGQPGHVPFQRAHLRGVRARVAGDVELGRGVGLQAERGGVVLLGGEQAGDVAGQLAERAGRVGARRGHAVAVGRGGLDGAAHVGAGHVVALVRAEHEQRVGRGDAVGGQPLEERAERLVVVLRLRDVARGAGAERGRRALARGAAPGMFSLPWMSAM